MPIFEPREIEKPEVDRLFDLVGVVAREKNEGNVRLADVDGARRMRVGLRSNESFHEVREIHGINDRRSGHGFQGRDRGHTAGARARARMGPDAGKFVDKFRRHRFLVGDRRGVTALGDRHAGC